MLFPRNATILVGSMLEVTSRGGPKPDSNIVYKVINEDVLSIDGSVVQGLKEGKTKVMGQSVGINPANGNKIVFSEDVIYVNVVPLTGIKIKIPLRRLRSDAIMPASIWGKLILFLTQYIFVLQQLIIFLAEPDISPLVLGTLQNLNIIWTTDQPDILEVKGRFDDMNVIYDNKDSISVRIRGLKQGKAKIFATLYTQKTKFVSTVDVTIFKTLELESPKRIIYDPIIIPPRTTLQLKTNLDEAFYDLSDTEERDVINVSRDGIVRSSEVLGRSLVVATSVDQKLSIPIEVKSIHYVLAKLQNDHITLKQTESELPQKLNIVLKVTLHDNLGNEFSHDFNDLNNLKYKLSKKDAVDVHIGDNFTLSVSNLIMHFYKKVY